LRLLDLLPALAGLVILGVVIYDIFSTVLHHWGGAGPLSGRLAHLLWRALLRITEKWEPGRRRVVLGQAGPLMIPLIVTLWAGLIIVSFALVYLPWIATHFAPDTGAPEPVGFSDALHFSGVSFFTIGYGDVVPITPGMRLLGVLEGGAGFAMITLVISYFTSLYVGYSQQKTLAQSVHFQSAMTADAARLIGQHLHGGATTSLINEIARLRDGLANIRSNYTTYPILHYFVASRPEQSLVRLLFVTQDLRLLLDTALDPEDHPALAGLGERSGLLYSIASVQAGIAETLLRNSPSPDSAAASKNEQALWRERFRLACDMLAEHGLSVRRDPDAAESYCRQRGEWEPTLRASAWALGEPWDEIVGDF
jgi:hypothetical protein